MRRPWHESTGIIPWLIIIALILLFALIIKKGALTASFLITNKDVVDIGSDIITSLFLIIAGVLSYFRFFKGRTLGPKLIITPVCGAIQKPDGLLHWIEVELKNTGSVSIWNYNVNIIATIHGEADRRQSVTDFIELPKDLQQRERLIDVGESAFEHAFLIVPCDALAVTFQILVSDRSTIVWTRSITVANKLKDDNK